MQARSICKLYSRVELTEWLLANLLKKYISCSRNIKMVCCSYERFITIVQSIHKSIVWTLAAWVTALPQFCSAIVKFCEKKLNPRFSHSSTWVNKISSLQQKATGKKKKKVNINLQKLWFRNLHLTIRGTPDTYRPKQYLIRDHLKSHPSRRTSRYFDRSLHPAMVQVISEKNLERQLKKLHWRKISKGVSG